MKSQIDCRCNFCTKEASLDLTINACHRDVSSSEMLITLLCVLELMANLFLMLAINDLSYPRVACAMVHLASIVEYFLSVSFSSKHFKCY